MTPAERTQERDALCQEITRITHEPTRRNRVRRTIFGLEGMVDPVSREILDPCRAEIAFALLGQLFTLIEQEAETPR